jgi:signal transduction histidine kinase
MARLRAERDAAFAERDALIASLGHELRTPANAILGYAELIGGNDRYAAPLREAGLQLIDCIDSVVDMARMRGGTGALLERETDVTALARDVAASLSALAGSRDMRLELGFAAALPTLRCDPRMLTRVLINLVGNALRHATAGTLVRLHSRIDHARRFVIEVRDEGPGIAAATLNAASTPLGSAAADARVARCSGLGLPLSRALVELHGGTFRILSHRGTGTRVLAVFPADRSGENTAYRSLTIL